MIITSKRLKWLPWQLSALDHLITSQMKERFKVDFDAIAQYVKRPAEACERIAIERGHTFIKAEKIIITKEPFIKGDMRNLPLHKNGKFVNYRTKGEEYMRSYRD